MRTTKTMKAETKDAMKALGLNQPGGEGTKTTGEEPDYKALYEKAQHELDVVKVEQGRVRKLNEELQAKNVRIAELEKGAALGALPDELKETVPEAMKEAALLLSKGVVDKAMHEQEEALAAQNRRLAEIERRQQEEAARGQSDRIDAFMSELTQAFPDFMKGLAAGGTFKAAWDEYQVNNAESLSAGFAACDFRKVSYHIKRFCESTDFDPSGGRGDIAAPDPCSLGGGVPRHDAGGSKTYTMQEYNSLQEKARRLREEYRFDEYRKLSRELEDAWSEGRVKQS